MYLQTPLTQAGRVYKLYAKRLANLGIEKLEDFLYHIPSRYEDFSIISPIAKVQPGEVVTIQGKVLEIKNVYTKNYKKLQEAKVQDQTGTIQVVWFNQTFLTRAIHSEDLISLAGRIEWSMRKIALVSPQYEIVYPGSIINGKMNTIHTGRLVPIYPETKGVSSKWLRRQVYKIIYENGLKFDEYIPYSILENNNLIGIKQAFEHIHFPKKLEDTVKAKERLSFDEVFLLQLKAIIRKRDWEKELVGLPMDVEKYQKNIKKFWELLPFELTTAQHKVLHDILGDISSKTPMNRLVQGDVGSGKTVVATIAMYVAFLNGYQSALIAPTQILAQQHFATITKLLKPFGIEVALATSNVKPKGRYEILVGTHAILSDKISFLNLGLVVIDEQQRFGVEQRAKLRSKGNNPHVLTMTATPIPRTMALTLYGDLNLSVIDEMPKGRQNIKTWLVPNEKRESGYHWIEQEIIKNKTQAFIVCPFIEQSESMTTVKAATKEFEHLQDVVFTNLRLGLLHGKMKANEKEVVLEKFKKREIDILVATPVVEVGIDFPNAAIIVIEAAERFGLAQLHQLRGRVGRGEKQSYCLLFTESQSPLTKRRLASLERIHIGARLAELDLQLRGPGEVYGTAQSGQDMLKIASFSDLVLIEKAKKEVEKLVPVINKYPVLLEKIQETGSKQVSPD